MAIKVSGTTVIDDSRNLQNSVNMTAAGNVYANTFIGDGSQLTGIPASGGTVTATATGALTDGSLVAMLTDGTVAVLDENFYVEGVGPATFAGAANPYGGSNGGAQSSVYDPSTGNIVIAFSDASASYYGKVVAGKVSGSTITFGTPVVFDSNFAYNAELVYDTQNQRVIVVNSRGGGTGCYPLSMSGTAITVGTRYNVDNVAYTSGFGAGYDEDKHKITIGYQKTLSYGSNRDQLHIKTIIMSGTSFTGTTSERLVGYGRVRNVAIKYDPRWKKLLMVATLRQGYSPYYYQGYSYYIKQTNDSTVEIESQHATWHDEDTYGPLSLSYDPNNQYWLIVYSDATNSYYGKVVVGHQHLSESYENQGYVVWDKTNETTFETSYTAERLAGVYDEFSQKLVVAYGSSNGSRIRAGAVSGSVDTNTYTVNFDSPLVYNANTQTNTITTYDPSSGKVVVTAKISSSQHLSNVYTAAGQNLKAGNFLGISNGAYANGATATVQIAGSIDDAQSGLTPNQTYYALANGSLSTTAGTPSVVAGRAITATKLMVKG